MAAITYLLCTLTALTCCLLLWRAHRRTRAPLLFWSGLCFAFLTLENLILCLDRIVWPHLDLWAFRRGTALIAITILVFGLVWKKE